MDDTSFDLSEELERAIHIIIDKIESGIASDAEVLILPKLIRTRVGFLVCSCDPTDIDAFELALEEGRKE